VASEVGSLGQLVPAAAGWETLFEVPVGKCLVAGRLYAVNFDAAPDAYRIAIAVAGAADADEQAIAWGVPIPGTGTPGHSGRPAKGGNGLTAGPGDLVRVWSDNGTVAFNLSGALRDALADDVPDFRVLAQVDLAAAGLEDVYTSPDQALLGNVVFCNRNAAARTITLTKAMLGAADDDAHRLIWQETLEANDVFVFGKGDALTATDVLRADASGAGVTVGVYGWGVAEGGGAGAPWNNNWWGPPHSMYFG
jgi:hypothetical protein